MSQGDGGQYRFRLSIGLPLVVICFTLAAGLLPLGMFDALLTRANDTAELNSLLLRLKIAVLVITVMAASLAVAISRHILGPLEMMINEMELVADRGGKQGDDEKTDDEIDRLSRLYSQTFVPMKGYLNTSDLFLQMTEGVVSLNADGKIAFLNAPVERLLAVERLGYIGRHYGELFPNSTKNAEVHDLVESALHHGVSRTRDILVSTPAGRGVYVRTKASPAIGDKNESLGVVLLFQDIEELGRLRDQLRRMDVLASLGSTISGMAHEVRTPLGYIRGLAELVKEDLPKETPQQKYLQTIIESIDRLNSMVEEILSLASVNVDRNTLVDPAEILRESIVYVRDKINEKQLRLIEDYPDKGILVNADRQKLLESFLNILKNGCEAAPQGTTVNVQVRRVIWGTTGSDDTVMVGFHNEGSYIPPETMEKLFTPFFTTKKQGTGLGLAISKQIIEAHGGAIHVESKPDYGTLFRVLLPLATAESLTAQHAESAV